MEIAVGCKARRAQVGGMDVEGEGNGKEDKGARAAGTTRCQTLPHDEDALRREASGARRRRERG